MQPGVPSGAAPPRHGGPAAKPAIRGVRPERPALTCLWEGAPLSWSAHVGDTRPGVLGHGSAGSALPAPRPGTDGAGPASTDPCCDREDGGAVHTGHTAPKTTLPEQTKAGAGP